MLPMRCKLLLCYLKALLLRTKPVEKEYPIFCPRVTDVLLTVRSEPVASDLREVKIMLTKLYNTDTLLQLRRGQLIPKLS